MADITMCHNYEGCLVKDNCYRHTATCEKWQSWADFNIDKGVDCANYWPVNEASHD